MLFVSYNMIIMVLSSTKILQLGDHGSQLHIPSHQKVYEFLDLLESQKYCRQGRTLGCLSYS